MPLSAAAIAGVMLGVVLGVVAGLFLFAFISIAMCRKRRASQILRNEIVAQEHGLRRVGLGGLGGLPVYNSRAGTQVGSVRSLWHMSLLKHMRP